ncbi:g6122 [Coccomyxa viridis]|uniref:PRA1 family protein n=1 Tax=Coccomyxa viridis TaxID=1274662 RepID=A0ABP1FVY4_9CHLO
MDWQNTTFEEFLSSLQEVDWTLPPRSIKEFCTNFTGLPSRDKLAPRVKCNLYYFRTNYLLLMVLAFAVTFLRKPWALVAIAVCLLGGLCLNDPFATSVSDRILRLLRKVHPPTALRLRARSGGHSGLGAPGRTREVRIAGVKRTVVVGALLGLGVLLLWRTHALLYLAIAVLVGDGAVLLHAVFRAPNLKARMASARQEFRAVWRGYQTDFSHDYTL